MNQNLVTSGINSMALRETMSTELDKAIVQGATVGFFEDNVLRAKFVGAKSVIIPEVDMSGLGDYNRDTGFVQGAVTLTHEPFTLQQDRARTFQIDREDEDETGIANLAGQMLGEFVRTKVVPEVDAYCLSKLGGYAADNAQTVTGTPATEAHRMFADALFNVREAVGYDEELVCFAEGAFLKALAASPEIQRQIIASNFKKGGVDTQVKELDGVKLLPVPASRMKTAYNFKNGGSGQEEGGFVPDESAKSIGFVLLPKRCASLVKKSEKMRTFAPDKNLNADAWKIDYRIYYDMFLKNSMKKGIYAYVY